MCGSYGTAVSTPGAQVGLASTLALEGTLRLT